MNYYYGLNDTTEYPIVRWNPQVPRNVGAKTLEPQEYEPHYGQWETQSNGDSWAKDVN